MTSLAKEFDAAAQSPDEAILASIKNNTATYDSVAGLQAPDIADKNGTTALMWAAAHGHEGVFLALIEKHADTGKLNKWGHGPLMYATTRGHQAIISMLRGKNVSLGALTTNGTTALMLAAGASRDTVLQSFLDNGGKEIINNGDDCGNTALLQAARANNTGACKILLDNGADPALQNKRGWNALMYAAAGDQLDMTRLLLGKNAPLGAKSAEGSTALLLATERKKSSKAALAILAHAAKTETPENFAALLDTQDPRGMTPLMNAAANNDKALLEALSTHGASWLVMNNDHKNASDLVLEHDRKIINAVEKSLSLRLQQQPPAGPKP